MKDPRMVQLAHNLVNYSCKLKPGEKIWIEGTGAPAEFMAQLVEEAYAAGGIPYVNLKEPKVERALAMGYTDQQLDWLASGDGQRMRECQAYIGVRAGDNSYETETCPRSVCACMPSTTATWCTAAFAYPTPNGWCYAIPCRPWPSRPA